MKKLNTVIVDDEQDSIALLQLELLRSCPSIGTVHSFTSAEDALAQIPALNPDVVFVDIEMPFISGFELLERLQPFSFAVIFVTAFNEHAIRAFRFNALDYLLKPVDNMDLQTAVGRAERYLSPHPSQLLAARQQLKGVAATRMALPGQKGITFIHLNDIVYVEASDNYSRFYMSDGGCHIVSRTLKEVHQLLETSHFVRIHRQYLVNVNCVQHFNRNDGIVTMDNHAELPIVRKQYESLLEKYRSF